jgi:hypothetical protein
MSTAELPLTVPEHPTASALDRKRPTRVTPDTVRAVIAYEKEHKHEQHLDIGQKFDISRTTVGMIVRGFYEITMENGREVARLRRYQPAGQPAAVEIPAAPEPPAAPPAPLLWRDLCYGCMHWGEERAADGVPIRVMRGTFEPTARVACGRLVKRFPFGKSPDGRLTSAGNRCDAQTHLSDADVQTLIPASERG